MNSSTDPALSSANYWKGIAACLVATILFGAMFPVMTDALRYIDPFTFTSFRYLIAGVGFVALLLHREGAGALRADSKSLLIAWLLGSIGFCGFGSFVFLGQQLAGEQGAFNASIMMATQPMMGMLVNAAVRRSAPPLPSLLFVAVSFAGVALVITRGDLRAALLAPQHYAASGLIVLGAICWVVYTFGASYFTRWSALKYTTMTTWLGLTTIVGVNVLLVVTHAISAPKLAVLWTIAPHLIYMGPVAGFAAILCWIFGNKTLGPMNGVLFMDVVPVTTFAVSALTGVVPGGAQIFGAVMTASALVLNNLYLRQRARLAVAATT
ncbi:EamA-like transporter family protein [Paraburkholderia fungorum]|uniref:EamA-like transporter family protein n=1 Tax=Paraburkholderia fungorum TaxID=134537 RepID=A0A1H1INN9_9BURK|nr:DMT family transporter [Paraburkholderia fungorum]SDR39283.1 EamA-like transporter family protein [Paraburkholderia fungorum]